MSHSLDLINNLFNFMESKMFIRKMCYGFAAVILVASIQGCGKSDDSKAVVSTPAPVSTETMKFSSVIQAEDMVGSWFAGSGQATVEKQPDGYLKLTNDRKDVAHGKIEGGIMDCKEWSVTVQLSQDKKVLVWSNGSTWHR
jgi:hypothetical protein